MCKNRIQFSPVTSNFLVINLTLYPRKTIFLVANMHVVNDEFNCVHIYILLLTVPTKLHLLSAEAACDLDWRLRCTVEPHDLCPLT